MPTVMTLQGYWPQADQMLGDSALSYSCKNGACTLGSGTAFADLQMELNRLGIYAGMSAGVTEAISVDNVIGPSTVELAQKIADWRMSKVTDSGSGPYNYIDSMPSWLAAYYAFRSDPTAATLAAHAVAIKDDLQELGDLLGMAPAWQLDIGFNQTPTSPLQPAGSVPVNILVRKPSAAQPKWPWVVATAVVLGAIAGGAVLGHRKRVYRRV